MHPFVLRLQCTVAKVSTPEVKNAPGEKRSSSTRNATFSRQRSASLSNSGASAERRESSGSSRTLEIGEQQSRSSSKLGADISPHRAVVVVRLLRVELGGAFSDVISGDGESSWRKEMSYVERTLGFRTPSLKAEGMRLVTEEVAGVIRWKKYLDFLIYSLSNKDSQDFDRMEPLLRQILRLGAFELLKLDMPAYAVVNEAVKLANAALRPGAGKLVNALLRALSVHKEKNTVPVPEAGENARSRARALATVHSHPVWMVKRWTDRYGPEEAVKLMEWNNSTPTYGLRANPARGTSPEDLKKQLEKLEVAYVNSPYLDDFVRLTTGLQEVLRAGMIEKGRCTVQDESAGLVVAVLDPQPGETVVDCCAAPGGKTLYIASRLKGKGKVIAVDINKARLGVLKDAAEKAGVADRVSVFSLDARKMIHGKTGLADKVLLDAPCSGLGVLSKRADLRWRRTPECFQELVELQDQLLDGASKMVRPGGVLVYSTCSIEPEENADRMTSFLARNKDFTLESAEGYVPEEMVSAEGYFNSFPHVNEIDGAFAARLRRKDEEEVKC